MARGSWAHGCIQVCVCVCRCARVCVRTCVCVCVCMVQSGHYATCVHVRVCLCFCVYGPAWAPRKCSHRCGTRCGMLMMYSYSTICLRHMKASISYRLAPGSSCHCIWVELSVEYLHCIWVSGKVVISLRCTFELFVLSQRL